MDTNQTVVTIVDQAASQAEMTMEQMQARIKLLSEEMDANDEENRMMQSEIDGLYTKIDAMTEIAKSQLVLICKEMVTAGQRVDAVKKYRLATGASLKAAQQALGIL